MRSLKHTFLKAASLLLFFAIAIAAQSDSDSLNLRFVNSETGFGIEPQVTFSKPDGTLGSIAVDASGRSNPQLQPGSYNLTIIAEDYDPMSAVITVDGTEQKLQFILDPQVVPNEILARNVSALHRPDATLFTGYVSGDDTGGPLENVRIITSPSGVETRTDARGFFRIFVPLQSDTEWAVHPAKLYFEKAGYQIDERHRIELSPFGDLIMRVVLFPGAGARVTDEEGRRISSDPAPYAPRQFSTKNDIPASNLIQPTNATVRIPRNIRVRLADNVTVETMSLETYCKRSLNDEWFSSWGNLNGTNGLNCLMAGSVANRSYAAWHVRNPRGSDHDICATTSCQVYDTDTATSTDNAVNQVAGYVVLDSSDNIARSEYSAENNSAGFPCGDRYTAPTGACLYDPVCEGETRFGHGRGMCQWGTARWATGYRMNGPTSGDSVSNGFPPKNWKWIVTHYYPTLQFVKAQPLVIGDDVKALINLSTRSCGGGTITNGTACPLLATQASGTTGVIVAGPVQVSADGNNHTWWQIRWNDATNTVGWSVENYLERVVPAVGAPSGLTATTVATNQINVAWTDTNTFSAGTKIERAYSSNGPWLQIKEIVRGITNYSDTTVFPGNVYSYRVRAYNVTGNSSYSNRGSTSTPAQAPVYASIANRTVTEGTTLSFSTSATVTPVKQPLTDFEGFNIETSTGTILLRSPRFSASTSAFIAAAPDYSSVTDLFPSGTGKGSRVLFVNCNVTNATAAWLRLTSSGATTLPNPVIDLTQQLSFDIRSDRQIRVAVGVRETTNAANTIVGSDGGTGGGIEWVGVVGQNVTAPVITSSIASNTWTTVTFNFPTASIRNFSGGNNVLSTASGLGTLEHIAIVPDGGTGVYYIYIDNLTVVRPRTITYSLDAGAPAGAAIDSQGGFNWTPTETQGPGVYTIRAIATASGTIGAATTNTFTVTVNEVNQAPVLAAISDRTIHAGTTFVLTNSASDGDIPANTLTFSLTALPSGAAIGSNSGVVTWPTTDAHSNTTNNFTVRVADNGSPVLSDTESFAVAVNPRPMTGASAANGVVTLTWSAIAGGTYKVQYKNDLNDVAWIDLTTITASGSTASVTNSPGSQRYYRIVAL